MLLFGIFLEYCIVASSRVGYATPPKALSMHSATCSIKLTVSDWFTAVHNDCFRSIDWLVAWFLWHAWLLYSYQMIVFFLTAFKVSFRNIYTPKKSDQKWPEGAKSSQEWPKVARSGQKWPEVARSSQEWPKVGRRGQKWPEFSEDLRNSSFRLEKITEESIKNALSLVGSWMNTVHSMF